jgi:hypothetical protein
MRRIGESIGGNEATPALAQWLALRTTTRESGAKSREWEIRVPAPSPIVIDFLPGAGLAAVKRYSGHFVTGRERDLLKKPETGDLRPEVGKATVAETGMAARATTRREEFTVQMRTANGNLYEVYPMRQAGPAWEQYLEHHENFTLSFYGRASLDWRFREQRPVSLALVFYPNTLPATYEFRRLRLLRLQSDGPGTGKNGERHLRHGEGDLVLYNFSDEQITGTLDLPDTMKSVRGAAKEAITLKPMERRVVNVSVTVPGDSLRRHRATVGFTSSDSTSAGRWATDLMPALEGVAVTSSEWVLAESRAGAGAEVNAEVLRHRNRATEGAPMSEVGPVADLGEKDGETRNGAVGRLPFVAFTQEGASVEPIPGGFRVNITGRPPNKQRRVEVEIPFPDGIRFDGDEFVSLEYRLVDEVR